SAQVWEPPAAIALTPLVSPETSTGVCRWVVVPSPSWPKSFEPQHLTPPEAVRAQVWPAPAETADAIGVAAAVTGAGAELKAAEDTAIATPARTRTRSERRAR